MEPPSAGEVVLVSFPFSDLSGTKLRPAVVLAYAGRDDWVLCQVTSRPYADPRAIPILETGFVSGGLQRESYARPGKLFTANRAIIRAKAGLLREEVAREVVDAVVAMLVSGRR